MQKRSSNGFCNLNANCLKKQDNIEDNKEEIQRILASMPDKFNIM